jgi:hypothetical protein
MVVADPDEALRQRLADWFWGWWPFSMRGFHIGRTRLTIWKEQSDVGEWWTWHLTLHRYGLPQRKAVR